MYTFVFSVDWALCFNLSPHVLQVQESTNCIQELQIQLNQINGEKERLRNIMESQLHGMLAENQQLKAQLQDSQLLVNEQHTKCFKLSEGKTYCSVLGQIY